MAKKKRAAKRRPKRRSTAMGDRTPKRRSKRRARRTKGLGDMFTPDGAKQGFITTALGFGGGIGAGIIDSVLGDNAIPKGVVSLGGAFALSAMGMKSLGAGLAGGYGALLEKKLEKTIGLSDDFDKGEYADEDAMSDYPDALTEDGRPLFLCEDGQFYLADDMLRTDEGDLVLSDGATPYDSSMAVANY